MRQLYILYSKISWICQLHTQLAGSVHTLESLSRTPLALNGECSRCLQREDTGLPEPALSTSGLLLGFRMPGCTVQGLGFRSLSLDASGVGFV